MQDFHIQWHITNRCNLRCLHCYQNEFSSSGELDWAGLKVICDNLINTMRRQDKRLTMSLTGGEPFLKEELFRLIEYLSLSEQIRDISIITNGLLVDKYILELKKYPKLSTIFVSLEGVTPEVNDSIRGEQTFRRVEKNIKLLKEHKFTVFIMFTVSKRNLRQAEALLDFSKKNSLDGFILERFIPLGQGEKMKEELLSSPELERLFMTIFSRCQIDYFREAVQYHALRVELKGNAVNLFGAECVVGKFGCAILPGGEVLPCRRFYLPIGNLADTSLYDIWKNSEILNKIRVRDNLQGKCRHCRIADCFGCRALAHAVSGDYLAEDPLCWLASEADLAKGT